MRAWDLLGIRGKENDGLKICNLQTTRTAPDILIQYQAIAVL